MPPLGPSPSEKDRWPIGGPSTNDDDGGGNDEIQILEEIAGFDIDGKRITIIKTDYGNYTEYSTPTQNY